MSALRARADVAGAVLLFALAAAVGWYALWSFGGAQAAIGAAVEAGQLALEGSEFDVAAYLMSNSGQYGVLSIVLAALGWLVLRTRRHPVAAPAASARPAGQSDVEEDGDLDELLDGAFDETAVETADERPR